MDDLRSAFRSPAAPVGPLPSIPAPAMEQASAPAATAGGSGGAGLGVATAQSARMRPFVSGSEDCDEGLFRHRGECVPVVYTHASTVMPGVGVDPARRGPDPVGDGPAPVAWMDRGLTLAERM